MPDLKWVFESDYYRELIEKANLTNPTPLTSSGEDMDAILDLKWVFESDYYRELIEKANLTNSYSSTRVSTDSYSGASIRRCSLCPTFRSGPMNRLR